MQKLNRPLRLLLIGPLPPPLGGGTDIRKTSLGYKEIDLTLMVDVLEHVPDPIKALKEVRRISNFAIFKVPLEDNLFYRTWDFVRMGKLRQNAIEKIGHINIYNFSKLKHQLKTVIGEVLHFDFTNVFDYYLNSERYNNSMSVGSKLKTLKNLLARYTFRLSPKLHSIIWGDFAVILVKCK